MTTETDVQQAGAGHGLGPEPSPPSLPQASHSPRESEGERERAAGGGRMTGSPENIPLGECPLSQSRDQLTPPSRTESTVFSLSRSESLWTTEASGPGIYQVYWFAIHLMTTGGSFLACGVIISGLYFTGYLDKVTRILGPGLLSIGLMVLVVGVVLIPITKKNRKQPVLKRPLSYYRPPQFNV
ncbi:phosphoinositide-interacting protein-like [Gadus chalcogrammus]|uniref:phosphoinositide-interacting protein-like n=1 Tax=Gadus chalcogrammus TaxID=1042646 RepID=UPI0024C439F2|nr:phosphoinositide-interacting protein-like [Gadus chalcogrammus]